MFSLVSIVLPHVCSRYSFVVVVVVTIHFESNVQLSSNRKLNRANLISWELHARRLWLILLQITFFQHLLHTKFVSSFKFTFANSNLLILITVDLNIRDSNASKKNESSNKNPQLFFFFFSVDHIWFGVIRICKKHSYCTFSCEPKKCTQNMCIWIISDATFKKTP